MSAAVLCAASLASAAPPRVVVIAPGAQHAAGERLRAELALLGMDVGVTETAPADPYEVLGHGVDAVALVEDTPPRVRIWVSGPANAPGTSLVLEVRALAPDESAQSLALRAVELLRARMLPLDPAHPAPVPQPPVPQPEPDPRTAPAPAPQPEPDPRTAPAPQPEPDPRTAPAPQPEPDPRTALATAPAEPVPSPIALYLAPALVVSAGGVPAAPEIRVAFAYRLLDWLELDAGALLPTVTANVGEPGRGAALRLITFGGGTLLSFTEPASIVGAFVGLGVHAAVMTYDGDAEAPLSAASGASWSAEPYTELGLRVRADALVVVRADAALATLLPAPIVRIAGSEVATLGRPLAAFSAGVELTP